MRIWSLHPKYLDSKGLVALWREALLAKNVLSGTTKGYRSHPQLDRFKKIKDPLGSINQYLSGVYEEAIKREYNFNKEKIDWDYEPVTMTVSTGQIEFESLHLLNKLKKRDLERFKLWKDMDLFEPHPLFHVIEGQIEAWEIISV